MATPLSAAIVTAEWLNSKFCPVQAIIPGENYGLYTGRNLVYDPSDGAAMDERLRQTDNFSHGLVGG